MFVALFKMISGVEKVFDVYRNDKRDMLALPCPCFTLHITGATAEKEFSRSATKLSRPFRTSNFP
ncbi:hypothetical protein ACVWWG_001248 [Bradyrhizobium sp. LB7.2]